MAQSDIETFARAVDSARHQAHASIADLSGDESDAGAAALPMALSHQLVDAVEELQVAEEELRAQNVALMDAHEELERERHRYRALFDSAPRPLVVTDAEGAIQLVNREGATLLGASVDVLPGKPLAAYVALDDRPQFRERLHAAAHARDGLPPLSFPLTITPRDGSDVRGVAMITRTTDARGTVTLLWTLPHAPESRTDEGAAPLAVVEATRQAMTELRRVNDELRQANRETLALLHREQRVRRAVERAEGAKSHFFAVLSHELRTPVQAILGYTELLARDLDDALTPTRREFLRRIQQSERHLLGLVHNVLDYDRIARGVPVPVEATLVPVHELLEAVEVMMSTLAADKEQVLEVDRVEPELTVSGDRAMMQQILVNLVHNAIKFTSNGGRIELRVRRSDDGATAIAVCDTGRGIPREKLEQIFDPFAQVVPDDLRQGSGLGLAISRNLARTLGGDLVAESEPGVGSCFTLTLPGTHAQVSREE